jgi:hypothetical protein
MTFLRLVFHHAIVSEQQQREEEEQETTTMGAHYYWREPFDFIIALRHPQLAINQTQRRHALNCIRSGQRASVRGAPPRKFNSHTHFLNSCQKSIVKMKLT